jgi:hypothetical protein
MSKEQRDMMDVGDQRRNKKKVVVYTEEIYLDYRKFNVFRSKLYLPDYLKYFFFDKGGLVDSSLTFTKKKEAENYVYLEAVKRLYQYGLFGDDFYPNLNKVIYQKYIGNCSTDNHTLPDSFMSSALTDLSVV